MKKYLNTLMVVAVSLLITTSCEETEPPEACFEPPNALFAGTPSAFNSSCTQNASSFSWNFGDGGTSTDTNPLHTYADAGSYTVTLVADNDEGDSDEISITVIVTVAVGKIHGRVVTPYFIDNQLDYRGPEEGTSFTGGVIITLEGTEIETTTSFDGHFAIDAVPEGIYTMKVGQTYPCEEVNWWASARIVVTAQTDTEVPELKLNPGRHVLMLYGKVYDRDSITPVANKLIRLVDNIGNQRGELITSNDGSYAFGLLYSTFSGTYDPDGSNQGFTIFVGENSSCNWTRNLEFQPNGLINVDAWID
jgi:PKD repeat protein